MAGEAVFAPGEARRESPRADASKGWIQRDLLTVSETLQKGRGMGETESVDSHFWLGQSLASGYPSGGGAGACRLFLS